MFRKKIDEDREILLQAFYNLEDKISQKLDVGDAVIAFTATADGTNKIASIYTIAKHLAEENERILVIDTNLRSDELEDLKGSHNNRGFVDLLLGDYHIEDVLIKDDDNLHLLMTGRVSEYEEMFLEPSVIKKFFEDVKDRYDYVFLNVKENIGIAEANVFAGLADKTAIFTTKANSESYLLEESASQLEKSGADIIGVIISDYDYKEDELDDLFGGN